MKYSLSLSALALLVACCTQAPPDLAKDAHEPADGSADGSAMAAGQPPPEVEPSPLVEPTSESEPVAQPDPERAPTPAEADPMPDEPQKITKTDEEWRAQLSAMEYRVTRQAGTERAFTGRYWDTKTIGTYKCICCDTPLFRSDSKFDSGCGWPSFFEPLEGARIDEHLDTTLGMVRREVRCAKCDAHLGHVFPDGPPPTGLRYCINSVSLMLDPDAEKASADDQ